MFCLFLALHSSFILKYVKVKMLPIYDPTSAYLLNLSEICVVEERKTTTLSTEQSACKFTKAILEVEKKLH